MSNTLFNISQINRGILNQPPLKCECKQCEPGMYFECNLCGLLQPWCMGQADERPDTCDECFAMIERLERVLVGGIS